MPGPGFGHEENQLEYHFSIITGNKIFVFETLDPKITQENQEASHPRPVKVKKTT